MNLNTSEWKEFRVSSILKIYNGKGITKEEIEENEGDFTVVQSGEENNGVLGKINKEYCISKGYTLSEKSCLTVARSGSAGFVSFQKYGCVVGDSAKILLLEDSVATANIYVFLRTVLMANRFKYAYGRKVTEKKYMNDVLRLPIRYNIDGTPFIDEKKRYSEDGFVPDWNYMEEYIKSLHYKPLTTKNEKTKSFLLEIEKWKEFSFGKLIYEPYKSHAYTSDELTIAESEDSIRYITRTSENNGCEFRAKNENLEYIEAENAITIGDTTATCFYQSEKFVTGDHMVVVRAPWLNEITGLFIVAILNNEQYKYSYGRAFLMDRIKSTIIRLPIEFNVDGTPVIDNTYKYSEDGYIPDWDFMEKYIKALPYGDRLSK